MQDQQILDEIKTLVDREHALREAAAHGEVDPEEEARRMRGLEEALDQAWDLLRRRRALRDDAHVDPDDAPRREVPTVEGYMQ